jgi:hypothetical protein
MLFAELDIPAIMALSIPLLGIGIAIVSVLATNWRRAKVSEHRAVMIQNMLDRGFTSSEIERVLAASDNKGDKLMASCQDRRRHVASAR